jgi:hypothetical protein
VQANSVVGGLAATLAAPASAATAAHGVGASIAAALAAPVAAVSATHSVAVALAGTLAAPVAALVGNTVVGGLSATLAAPVAAIVAVHGVGVQLEGTVDGPFSSISVTAPVVAALAGEVPAPRCSMTVTHTPPRIPRPRYSRTNYETRKRRGVWSEVRRRGWR